MGTGIVLAIVGVVLTVVFGVWGILLYRRRYPGRITFFVEASVPLFHSIVRNMPKLSVLYEDEPVSEGIVLLKGVLINTGSTDILMRALYN